MTCLDCSLAHSLSNLTEINETEKKENLIALQEEQLSRQNLIQMLSYGFAALLLLILLLLYKSYKDKQKNNELLTSINTMVRHDLSSPFA